MNDQVQSLLRYALVFVGGLLANMGWVTDSDWTTFSGALVTVIVTGWAIYAKLGTKRVPEQTLTIEQKNLVK